MLFKKWRQGKIQKFYKEQGEQEEERAEKWNYICVTKLCSARKADVGKEAVVSTEELTVHTMHFLKDNTLSCL